MPFSIQERSHPKTWRLKPCSMPNECYERSYNCLIIWKVEASSTLDGISVAEAEKVAKRAAAALKESRKRCIAAPPGVPTWTGHHGEAGAPRFSTKRRFGAKSDEKICQKSTETSETETSLFSGEAIGKTNFLLTFSICKSWPQIPFDDKKEAEK